MKESYLRQTWTKKWVADAPDGVVRIMHRIPDAAGRRIPGTDKFASTGLRPFDSFGIETPGMSYAVEFKIMNGGKTFVAKTAFKGREHQLPALRRWHDAGGIALVVLGWVPTGKTRSQVFEIPIQDIDIESRLSLPDLVDETKKSL